MAAPVADVQMPAQHARTAVKDILHRPAVAGQELISKPGQVLRPVPAKNVRKFRHDGLPGRPFTQAAHQVVDTGMDGL
jgi:hypothetical protein